MTDEATAYEVRDPVVVRASTYPGGLEPPPDLNVDDPSIVDSRVRAWLAYLWTHATAREAIRAASPSSGSRIDQILAANPATLPWRKVRRAALTAAGYLRRWQHRATPFGLFASNRTRITRRKGNDGQDR